MSSLRCVSCQSLPRLLTRPYGKTRPSALRRINIDLDLSDAKYNGVKTSRRQLLEDDTNGNAEADHGLTSDEESEHAADDGSDSETSIAIDGEASHVKDDGPVRSSPESANPSPSLQEHDLTSALQASRLADRQKGKAISRQMVSANQYSLPTIPPFKLCGSSLAFLGYFGRCSDQAAKGYDQHEHSPSSELLLFSPLQASAWLITPACSLP